jgi:hypothetical protein
MVNHPQYPKPLTKMLSPSSPDVIVLNLEEMQLILPEGCVQLQSKECEVNDVWIGQDDRYEYWVERFLKRE